MPAVNSVLTGMTCVQCPKDVGRQGGSSEQAVALRAVSLWHGTCPILERQGN